MEGGEKRYLDNKKEKIMSKRNAKFLVIAMLLLTVANWCYARRTKASQQPAAFGQPACKSYVPQEWGDYKGSSEHYGVVFEANDGTLRFITNVACESAPQIALEIRRGSPPN
jgi:hypothetical protein